MRNAKKIVSALLAVMLMGSLLVGCGSKDAETAAPAVSEEAAAEKEEAPVEEELEPVELVIFIHQFAGTDDKVVEEAVNNLDAVKALNLTLKFKTLNEGDNYYNELDLALASGEQIDIAICDQGSHYPAAATDGAYYDLTEMLTTKYTTLYNTLREDHWKAATVNGGIYGVPTFKEGCLKWGCYISREFVDEYNIDLTAYDLFNIDELLTLLKEDGRETWMWTFNQSRYYEGAAIYSDYRSLVGSNAIMSIENPGTVENWYMTDKFRAICHEAKSWKDAGLIRDDIMTIENFDVQKKDPEVFGLETVTYFPGREYQEGANRGFDLAFLDLSGYVNVLDDPGWIQCVTANCVDPDRALAFLEVLNTVPEVKNTFTYGVEGVHYDLSADGQVDYTNYPDHADVWNGDSSRMGNMLIGYSPVGFPVEGYSIFDEAMKEAKDIPTIGFRANQEAITNEVAACNAVIEEYRYMLYAGVVEDVDAVVDEFIKKLNDAGAQTILETVQAQWDEFEASK